MDKFTRVSLRVGLATSLSAAAFTLFGMPNYGAARLGITIIFLGLAAEYTLELYDGRGLIAFVKDVFRSDK